MDNEFGSGIGLHEFCNAADPSKRMGIQYCKHKRGASKFSILIFILFLCLVCLISGKELVTFLASGFGG